MFHSLPFGFSFGFSRHGSQLVFDALRHVRSDTDLTVQRSQFQLPVRHGCVKFARSRVFLAGIPAC